MTTNRDHYFVIPEKDAVVTRRNENSLPIRNRKDGKERWMKVDAVDALIVTQKGSLVLPFRSYVPYDQFGSEAPTSKDVGLSRMPFHGPWRAQVPIQGL